MIKHLTGVVNQRALGVHGDQGSQHEGLGLAPGLEDVPVELRAGGRERQGGAGLERERKGEGVWTGPRQEHVAVQGESFGEARVLGELSQAGVPWGGWDGWACVDLGGFDGGGGRRLGAQGEEALLLGASL